MRKFLKTKKYSILSGILKYGVVIVFGVMLIGNITLAVVCPDGINREVCPDAINTDNQVTTTIKNPLGEDGPQTIPEFIAKVLDIILIIGIPIVTLAIIYVGFLFVKAQGNPTELTAAKKALVYTLIGAALLLGAFVIAEAIGKTVEDIKAGV